MPTGNPAPQVLLTLIDYNRLQLNSNQNIILYRSPQSTYHSQMLEPKPNQLSNILEKGVPKLLDKSTFNEIAPKVKVIKACNSTLTFAQGLTKLGTTLQSGNTPRGIRT